MLFSKSKSTKSCKKEQHFYSLPAPSRSTKIKEKAQRYLQLSKLEFKIKLQKLTNELNELKAISNKKKDSFLKTGHLSSERTNCQPCENGQDTSRVLVFPVIEQFNQQNERHRQYQTLKFMVIKDLGKVVAQYGPNAP